MTTAHRSKPKPVPPPGAAGATFYVDYSRLGITVTIEIPRDPLEALEIVEDCFFRE